MREKQPYPRNRHHSGAYEGEKTEPTDNDHGHLELELFIPTELASRFRISAQQSSSAAYAS